MSIVLPLLQFFHVEDLSREVVVSSVINALTENIKLVRKISQALMYKCFDIAVIFTATISCFVSESMLMIEKVDIRLVIFSSRVSW
jgi:hypothetical protein